MADGIRGNNRITEWGSFISPGIMTPQSTRDQMAVLNRRKSGCLISITTSNMEAQLRSFDPHGVG